MLVTWGGGAAFDFIVAEMVKPKQLLRKSLVLAHTLSDHHQAQEKYLRYLVLCSLVAIWQSEYPFH